MKLTWFGSTTLRIHIGGVVLVSDAAEAPGWVDRAELVSGADRTLSLQTDDGGLPALDLAEWRPRRPLRPLDQGGPAPEVRLYRPGPGCVLVDATGEPPLILLAGRSHPRWGRWADGAVVVLFGADEAMMEASIALLETTGPRMIALAMAEPAVDAAIASLRRYLDGVALSALEPGMAVEV